MERLRAGVRRPIGPYTPAMVIALSRTRPWAMFFSILMFVNMGLTLLLAPVEVWLDKSPTGVRVVALLMYVCMSIVYAGCGVYLLRFAERIRDFARTRSPRALEAVVVAQFNYWSLWGKITICAMVMGLVMIALVAAAVLRLFAAH